MLLKNKNIKEYQFENFKYDISFDRFSYIINNPELNKKTYRFIEEYDDIKCKKILLNKKYIDKTFTRNNQYLLSSDKKIRNVDDMNFHNMFKYKNNYLVITNLYYMLSVFNNKSINFDCILTYNENFDDNYRNEYVNTIKTMKYSNKIIGNYTNSQIKLIIDNKLIKKKYDNICSINDSFKYEYINSIFNILKVNVIIQNIYIGINLLNKSGNFYLTVQISFLNKVLHKLLHLLTNSFKNSIIKQNTYSLQFEFYDFQGVDDETLEKLRLMALESFEYYHPLCDIINFKYDYDLKYPNNKLYYNLTKIKGVEPSKTVKGLMVIDDINLKVKETEKSTIFIEQIESIISHHFNQLNYLILQHTSINQKTGEIKLDEDYIEKVKYDKLLQSIKFMEENKIAYKKNLLNVLYKYNENVITKLIDYDVKSKIIRKKKTKSKSTRSRSHTNRSRSKHSLKDKKYCQNNPNTILKKAGNYKEYHHDEYNNSQDSLKLISKTHTDLKDKLSKSDASKYRYIKKITEGVSIGLATYIQAKFPLYHKITIDYIILWEILGSIKNIIPDKKKVKIFHIAEAPGQWINCVRYYLETKQNNVENYEWFANTLNFTNKSNIKKFGNDMGKDDFQFIRKYQNKWLFGADNTGDITKTKNIEWFRDFSKKWVNQDNMRIDLITSDASLLTDKASLKAKQKLEYSQLCMIANMSSNGGNCVVKHSLNLDINYDNSYYGTGHLVSYLYLYYIMFQEIRLIKPYTSNFTNNTFYVVGLKFCGIDDKMLKKLLKQLDEFQENDCFFKKDDIPDYFNKQVLDFVEGKYKVGNDQLEAQTMLLTCIVAPDPVIEKVTQCKKYMDEQFIKKIQMKRYKEWIKTYNFE
jgi:hypothetical protein